MAAMTSAMLQEEREARERGTVDTLICFQHGNKGDQLQNPLQDPIASPNWSNLIESTYEW